MEDKTRKGISAARYHDVWDALNPEQVRKIHEASSASCKTRQKSEYI